VEAEKAVVSHATDGKETTSLFGGSDGTAQMVVMELAFVRSTTEPNVLFDPAQNKEKTQTMAGTNGANDTQMRNANSHSN
jgi:hypothetical protein